MRHPLDDLRIPAALQRVLAHLARQPNPDELEPWELAHRHAPWLYDLTAEVLAAGFGETIDEARAAPELSYLDTPFELAPVAWNGGDGLHYDLVVHAPELDLEDLPMASFAPGEDGAVWLGDTTAEGLAHLMVGARKGALEQGLEDPAGSPAWRALIDVIGVTPDLDDSRVTAGARSERFLVPPIPAGWRYEDGPDGVGVLAPRERFGDLDFEALPGEPATFEREARRLAAGGCPAGALSVLKNLRSWSPDDVSLVARMRDAYLALGRPMHARRAAIWLARRGP